MPCNSGRGGFFVDGWRHGGPVEETNVGVESPKKLMRKNTAV
jgi:hypothetical protein